MTQYTLAIIPPPEITKSVETFYRDFSQYRHTTLPPHVTVVPPFIVNELSNEKFLSILISAVLTSPEFGVSLNNIDCFRGRNNVVYLSVSSQSSLIIFSLFEKIIEGLKNHVLIDTATFQKEKFLPHLTLARHVPDGEVKSLLFEAKKRFPPTSFQCKSLRIFKNEGRGWIRVTDIKF